MIKITKEPIYEVRCSYCGCHFTFEKSDYLTTKANQYETQFSVPRYIKCPHCGTEIVIEDAKKELLPMVKVRYKK